MDLLKICKHFISWDNLTPERSRAERETYPLILHSRGSRRIAQVIDELWSMHDTPENKDTLEQLTDLRRAYSTSYYYFLKHLYNALGNKAYVMLDSVKYLEDMTLAYDEQHFAQATPTGYYNLNIYDELTANRDAIYVRVLYFNKDKIRIKKYIRELCDKHGHLEDFEKLIKTNQEDYLYAFRNVTNTGLNNEYIIFTEDISADLVDKITIWLPFLLDVTTTITNLQQQLETASTEEKKIIQKKIQIKETVLKLLAVFHQYRNSPFTKPEDLTKALETIRETYGVINTLINDPEENLLTFNTAFTERAFIKMKKDLLTIIADLERTRKHYDEQLQGINNELRTTYTKYNAYSSAPPAQNDTSFIDAIKSNKSMRVRSATKNDLILQVNTYLNNFTPEDLTMQLKSERSTLNALLIDKQIHYKKIVPNLTAEEIIETLSDILKQIFNERTIKLLIAQNIRIYVKESGALGFTAENNYDIHPFDYPNPHLYYFDCWGDAKSKILEHITNKDYDLALAQLTSAVQSINIAEGPTFLGHFISDFANPGSTQSDLMRVQLPDGCIMNLNQYIKISLLEKEAKKQQQQKETEINATN